MRWIIGDVHGMRAALERLLDAVGRVDSAARFYFVGDYVNRGPDARGVIELLLSLPNARFVRGNHDDIFDRVVNGESYADAAENDRMLAFQWFMDHGLDQTFVSYGVEYAQLAVCSRRGETARLEEIVRAVPEAHRRFVRGLPGVIEDEDLFVAHAKWDPFESDRMPNLTAHLDRDPLLRHRLLWGRYSDEEVEGAKGWRRTGFFGHTPVYAYAASQRTGELLMLPIAGPKMVLVDTGGALNKSGRLTAFCAEERTFIQVDHHAKLVEVGPA
jgi:hypothetical protein